MTLLAPLLRLLGLDALHKLTSSSVTELYTVEGDDRLWVDSRELGRGPTEVRISPEQVEIFLNAVASAVGVAFGPESPMLSAELPGRGGRLQGFRPPVVSCPVFVLRKPAEQVLSLSELVVQGFLPAREAEQLRWALADHKTILVVGGTGTGKTTFLNSLLDTVALPAGFYSARLAATNVHGTGYSAPFFFSIESLRFASGPSCTNQGNRTARCTATTEGATEHRWDWGDGTLSPWLVGCPGRDQTHTYAAAGTYSVRLRIRNCRDPLQVSGRTSVTVTASSPLNIVEFAADCPGGFCLFDVGEAVPFRHQVQGSPTTYAYDWDGDGFTDQVAGAPVATHSYSAPGSFTPRLTVTAGTQTASAAVPLPVIVFPSGTVPLFADGFESGTTQRWSLTVGKVVEGGRP
ncbi:MAG TPA: ATPase, T2SS/T4P/T4SS family [Thermoanaerobaculia bacterium]|nr:ATPase, T2SS/T4P/T4SS family [Thermoanaerobaculia bacterium]